MTACPTCPQAETFPPHPYPLRQVEVNRLDTIGIIKRDKRVYLELHTERANCFLYGDDISLKKSGEVGTCQLYRISLYEKKNYVGSVGFEFLTGVDRIEVKVKYEHSLHAYRTENDKDFSGSAEGFVEFWRETYGEVEDDSKG